MCPCAPARSRQAQGTVAAGLNAFVLLLLSLQLHLLLQVCTFGALVSTVIGASSDVRDWSSWSDPDVHGHQDATVYETVASDQMRQMHQQVEGDTNPSSSEQDAAGAAVTGAESLTTELRIARLHEQFQKATDLQGEGQVCPAALLTICSA